MNEVPYLSRQTHSYRIFSGPLIRKRVNRIADPARRHRMIEKNHRERLLIERLDNENPSHRVAAVREADDRALVRRPNVRNISHVAESENIE